MRIAIYSRVSTDKQDCDVQLTDLHNFIEAKSYTLVHEYVDRGISGAKSSRPQLDKLMQHASEGKFDAVLVWKLDRFGRSVQHLVEAISKLESYNVAFISLKDNVDLSTPQGRLTFHIISAMAEFERSLIVERTKAGLRNAVAKGKVLGRPTGSSIDGEHVRPLRESGQTWEQVSDALGCSVSTCKRAYSDVGEKKQL
jgi:DNA invertase Pin-like site-specific DNA recombinase